jgi:hypothetical protein
MATETLRHGEDYPCGGKNNIIEPGIPNFFLGEGSHQVLFDYIIIR